MTNVYLSHLRLFQIKYSYVSRICSDGTTMTYMHYVVPLDVQSLSPTHIWRRSHFHPWRTSPTIYHYQRMSFLSISGLTPQSWGGRGAGQINAPISCTGTSRSITHTHRPQICRTVLPFYWLSRLCNNGSLGRGARTGHGAHTIFQNCVLKIWNDRYIFVCIHLGVLSNRVYHTLSISY